MLWVGGRQGGVLRRVKGKCASEKLAEGPSSSWWRATASKRYAVSLRLPTFVTQGKTSL